MTYPALLFHSGFFSSEKMKKIASLWILFLHFSGSWTLTIRCCFNYRHLHVDFFVLFMSVSEVRIIRNLLHCHTYTVTKPPKFPAMPLHLPLANTHTEQILITWGTFSSAYPMICSISPNEDAFAFENKNKKSLSL